MGNKECNVTSLKNGREQNISHIIRILPVGDADPVRCDAGEAGEDDIPDVDGFFFPCFFSLRMECKGAVFMASHHIPDAAEPHVAWYHHHTPVFWAFAWL